jgi:hypothetical protein
MTVLLTVCSVSVLTGRVECETLGVPVQAEGASA